MELSGALERKRCFFKKSKRDHNYYFLMVDGKKTEIFTKVSFSRSTEYGDGLLSLVKRQLRFSSQKELFENFLECSFSAQQYIDFLRSNGIL